MKTSALLSVMALATPLTAQFTVLSGPCDFGVAQVVGQTPWVAGVPTRLGFDLFPNGTPIGTPNSTGTAITASDPLGTSFESVGVHLEADDVAVSQASNPAGLGLQSVPNALAGAAALPFNQPIEITFVDPANGNPATVPAAGMWIADGPTNDTSVEFRDGSGAVITTLTAGPQLWFAGIDAPVGIASIRITASAPDDYYIDDLHYGVAIYPGGLPATETVRLGTPANPSALLPGQTSGPLVGATWDPVIDHTTFLPGAFFDLFAIGSTAANVPFLTWGTILCDALLGPPLGNLAGTPFAIPIPNDCSLMGLTLCAQGVSTDGTIIALTNAIDITIGNI